MTLDKNKTVLLLIDFQNDLLDIKGKGAAFGIAEQVGANGTVEKTKKLLEQARASGIKPIFVKVEYTEGYPETKMTKAPVYQAMTQMGLFEQGSWGAEICAELKPREGELVVNKTRINPFSNPDFKKHLTGVETVIITGVATNFAVEATARMVADFDFEVIVVSDCCASRSKDMHDFSLTQVLPNSAAIMGSEEVLACF